MRSSLRNVAMLLVVSVLSGFAQVKEKVPPKPQPREQKIEIPVAPAEARPAARPPEDQRIVDLPKIDLPEFVIAGVALIDLPAAQKSSPDENAGRIPLVFADPAGVPRDRATVEIAPQEKLTLREDVRPPLNGIATANVGTHLTSDLGLWLSTLNPQYSYLAEARYHSTKGYVAHSNRTGGSLGGEGALRIRSSSSWLNGARAGGRVGYGSETYRFFGSANPSLTRTRSSFSLAGTLDSPPESSLGYRAAVGLRAFSISDSTTRTTENSYSLWLESWFSAGSIPLYARVQGFGASLSGSSSGSLPYFDLCVGVGRVWWGSLFAEISGHFYAAQGMLGQKLSRVYPHVIGGYALGGKSTLGVSYSGGVEAATLSSFVESSPYLSGTALVRHADVRMDLAGFFETDWDDVWRTRISARYRSINDYPMLTESVRQGVWTTAYLGLTEIITYGLDVFAKFDPIGYFAMTAAINSTKNSVTREKVPYLSDFEVGAVYSRALLPGLSVTPRLKFVDRRRIDLFAGNRLPGYVVVGLRTEYAFFPSLSIVVDVENAADRKYEVWRGYRAEPFRIAGGASFRW